MFYDKSIRVMLEMEERHIYEAFSEEHDDFYMYYQPSVDSKKIIGFFLTDIWR